MVLDPSIFVNAILQPESIEAHIIRTWQKDQFDILISKPLFNKIEQTVQTSNSKNNESRYEYSPSEILHYLEQHGIQTPAQLHLSVFQNDESANTVLSCAVEGKANYIISTNPNLLELKHYKGILILSPKSLQVVQ